VRRERKQAINIILNKLCYIERVVNIEGGGGIQTREEIRSAEEWQDAISKASF